MQSYRALRVSSLSHSPNSKPYIASKGCCPAADAFGPWFWKDVHGSFAIDITGSNISLLVQLIKRQRWAHQINPLERRQSVPNRV